ncbi:hypothetical protein JW905_09970 [bacterium]|nr:hypothetical protein [candidate division CSSED10-310 bacterium]
MNKSYELTHGQILMVAGRTEVTVVTGGARIVGASYGPGYSFIIPTGKRIPVEVEGTCTLQVSPGGKETGPVPSTIPADWENLVEAIATKGTGVIMLYGMMDTGKSFLATYLANRLQQQGVKTAVVDCDLGQSDIGPPGAMGMTVIERPVIFLSQAKPTAMYFVGAHSPGLHFIEFLNGVYAMVRQARRQADVVIVNTTGWIQGDGGRMLKTTKLRLLDPAMVVLLQRRDELEYLVPDLQPDKTYRLRVSHEASETSQFKRKNLREGAAVTYFKDARMMEIPFSSFSVEGAYFKTGEMLPPAGDLGLLWVERMYDINSLLVVCEGAPDDLDLTAIAKRYGRPVTRIIRRGSERGLLVGLLDAKRCCLALGIVDAFCYQTATVRLVTPLSSLDNLKDIQFGSLRMKPNGREAGYVAPGTF